MSDPPTPEMSLWADWLRASGARPRTVGTRMAGVKALASHASLDDPATATTADLIGWLGSCKTEWTRKTYYATARSWFGWLVDMGLRTDNPLERIAKPRTPRSLPRPAPTATVPAMLAHPTCPRAYAYTCLACYAGLRVHEIAKVRGEDLEGGWLYVDGKGGHRAAIPVHERIAALAVGLPERGYWFPGAEDGHVHATAVSQTLRNGLRRAGADGTAHSLRHWYGTAILRSSRDLRVTQELMRHASPASTAVYTQVASVDKQRAIASLNRLR